jgi:hypothetical protein
MLMHILFALVALLPLCLASPTPIKRAEYSGIRLVSGRDGSCLFLGAANGGGYQVTAVDCNALGESPGWDISKGSGSVIATGTNLALDAGSAPGNNGIVKVGAVRARHHTNS